MTAQPKSVLRFTGRKLKMAEMQWYAATDSGQFDGTAAITPRSGAVCLRAELPAGVL